MTLDKQIVLTIARLARLHIDESDIAKHQTELSSILDLVAQMDAVDTTDVEPMTHPFDAELRMREDDVTEVNQREKFQAIAPNSQDGLYLVPKVID